MALRRGRARARSSFHLRLALVGCSASCRVARPAGELPRRHSPLSACRISHFGKMVEQCRAGGVVSDLAACEHESQMATSSVGQRVNFRRARAARAVDGLIFLPPFLQPPSDALSQRNCRSGLVRVGRPPLQARGISPFTHFRHRTTGCRASSLDRIREVRPPSFHLTSTRVRCRWSHIPIITTRLTARICR